MADKLLTRNADALGDVVRYVEITRPDCSDALRDGRAPGICLYGVPEESGDHANHDGETCEVESETGASGDREGNAKMGANCTVEYHGNSVEKRAEDETDDCFAPSQAYCDD